MFVSFSALVKLSVNEKSFNNALIYFKLTGIYMYIYKRVLLGSPRGQSLDVVRDTKSC